MKRPLFLFTTALCFALITFIAGNVIYFRWVKNYRLKGLNEVEQVNGNHSEINEIEIFNEQITENDLRLSEKLNR